ncbi:hypothetical protein T492DRAFT_491637, partial [Pavlovales sp. CCMP2436]
MLVVKSITNTNAQGWSGPRLVTPRATQISLPSSVKICFVAIVNGIVAAPQAKIIPLHASSTSTLRTRIRSRASTKKISTTSPTVVGRIAWKRATALRFSSPGVSLSSAVPLRMSPHSSRTAPNARVGSCTRRLNRRPRARAAPSSTRRFCTLASASAVWSSSSSSLPTRSTAYSAGRGCSSSPAASAGGMLQASAGRDCSSNPTAAAGGMLQALGLIAWIRTPPLHPQNI